MRAFLLTSVFAIAIFNGFLGYSGAALSRIVHSSANHSGIELSILARFASALQPWFCLLTFCALMAGILGLRKKLSENQLTYLVILFLTVDTLGLWVSAWGFGTVHFLLRCPLD